MGTIELILIVFLAGFIFGALWRNKNIRHQLETRRGFESFMLSFGPRGMYRDARAAAAHPLPPPSTFSLKIAILLLIILLVMVAGNLKLV
jgi:hypothetical protein